MSAAPPDGAPSWLGWWLTDRSHTGPGPAPWTVGQWPNAAVWVFVVATVLRWTPWNAIDAELLLVGRGALVVWGADELFRGCNPLRRVLGALVLGWQVAALVTA